MFNRVIARRKSGLIAFMLVLSLVFAGLVYAADKPKDAPKADEAVKTQLMDINTATDKELMTLPGIGDAYAKKIIEGRPYQRKDQLKSKKIIPDATYEKIQDKIIAKQPK